MATDKWPWRSAKQVDIASIDRFIPAPTPKPQGGGHPEGGQGRARGASQGASQGGRAKGGEPREASPGEPRRARQGQGGENKTETQAQNPYRHKTLSLHPVTSATLAPPHDREGAKEKADVSKIKGSMPPKWASGE